MECYAALAQRILNETPFNILLIGGPNDIKFTSKLLIDPARCFDIAGKASIQQVYLALRHCRAMVAHDSGPMHIGAAAGIPVISLFGPTYPVEKYPITNDNSCFIWKGDTIDCAPCYKDGIYPDCESKECMRSITVDEAWDRLKELI